MMQLETKHWAVIGSLLIGIGTSISGLEHGWRDAFTTQFVGGQLIMIGTVITALFVGAPKEKQP